MELLSYLLTAAAVVEATESADTSQPRLPTFKPRFWHNPGKLDARPVAWSLRNRPEEWKWKHRWYTIEHTPSGHVFWVANGYGLYHLYGANCGCSVDTNCQFQRFQQGVFHRAFREWRIKQAAGIHDNFAGHFIH